MPHKLKSALISQQSLSAKSSAQQNHRDRQKLKEASIKSSLSGQRKSKPKPKQTSTTLPSSQTDHSSHIKDKGKSRATYPYERTDTILLLGEANFSFAFSLVHHHSHPPHLICATSYDTEQVCYEKYPDAEEMLGKLRTRGVKLGFAVDAGDLEGSRKLVGRGGRWSRIVFNFPHAGAGITDQDRNILTNQHLLLRTLRSAYPLLTSGPSRNPPLQPQQKRKRPRSSSPSPVAFPSLSPSPSPSPPPHDASHLSAYPSSPPAFVYPTTKGSILITLLAQPPYTLWSLPKLATRPPSVCPGTRIAQPKYRLVRSFRFDPGVYPGYEHRRTIGWKEGLSKGGNEEIKGRKGEARTWEFEAVKDAD